MKNLYFIFCILFTYVASAQNLSDITTNEIQSIGPLDVKTFKNKNTSSSTKSSQANKVLFLYAEFLEVDAANIGGNDIAEKLLEEGVGQVDFYNFTAPGTLPVSDLYWNYDAILLGKFGNGNPEIFGDLLALYADGGGGVVDLMESAGGAFPILGRFNPDYIIWDTPEDGTALIFGQQRTLGDILDPSHPVVQGVTSFSGGPQSIHFSGAPENNGQLLAEYDNGDGFIVINEDIGPSNARRVFINAFPISSDGGNQFGWNPNTDGALIMKNSLDWVANENSFDGCGDINLSVSNGFDLSFNASSSSSTSAATDLTVKRSTDFLLTRITANVAANTDISSVDISYYDDNAGVPGTVIQSNVGVTPTSSTIIGSQNGFNIYKIVLDVPAFLFNGQLGVDTTYWVEMSVSDNNSSSDVFWVGTSSSMSNNPMALFNGTSWNTPFDDLDGVYLFEGDCTPVYGDECVQEVELTYLFETGLNNSSESTISTANDIVVQPGGFYELDQIIFPMFSDTPIVSVDVRYYADNNGLPGSQIGFENGILPSFQNVVGAAFNTVSREVIIDVTPFTFENPSESNESFWVEIKATNANVNTFVFWEISSKNSIGNPVAFFDGNSWSAPGPEFDGVATFVGSECSEVLDIDEFEDSQLSLFPNPTNGMVNISSNSNVISKVKILSLTGQTIIEKETSSSNVTLNLSSLSSGMFIVSITTENGSVTNKRVVIR